jgi:hypothetical protein
MAFAFFYALSLIALLFGLIQRLRDGLQASLATFVMIAQPFVAYYGMMLFADLPLCLYFLASIGLMILFISEGERSLPILAGLMAGLSGWTKNEGLPFIITSTLAWIYIAFFLGRDRSALKNFLAGLSLPLLGIACFKIFLAPSNDLLSGGQDVLNLVFQAERYVFILRKSFQVLWYLQDGSISIVAILFMYALVVGRAFKPVKGIAPLLFIMAAQALIYFIVFLTSPHDLDWHVRSSIGRLYLHLFPSLILGLFLWLKSPAEMTAQLVQKENAADN